MRPTMLLPALALALLGLAWPADAPAAPRNPLLETEAYYTKLVNDWMSTYLNRKPTQRELALLVAQLRNGSSAATVQSKLLASDEYYRRTGGKTAQFIRALYADVLGQKATSADVLPLVAKCNAMGRQRFAMAFVLEAQGGPNPILTIPPIVVVPVIPVVPVPVPVPVPGFPG